MRLSELLAQIGHAGADAARQASEYSANRLLRHFNDDGTPKTVTLKIAGRDVEIPTFSLSRSGGLDLKTLRFELTTDLTIDEDAEQRNGDDVDACAVTVKLKRGLFQRQSHAKIEAEFQMGPPPEASSVVLERLDQQLREDLMSPPDEPAK